MFVDSLKPIDTQQSREADFVRLPAMEAASKDGVRQLFEATSYDFIGIDWWLTALSNGEKAV